MGNLGSGLGQLIAGAARGFGRAQREDKLKTQMEKAKNEERFNKIAGDIFGDTTQDPEIRRIAGAAAAGQKDAIKQLQDALTTGRVTVQRQDRQASALPQASEELPAIDINKEGKIARGQVLPDIPSPPPPTQEARERQVTTQGGPEEIPLFRDPRDIAKQQGELAAIAQRDLQEQTIELNEAAVIRGEQRKLDAEDKLIAESKGRTEEILGRLFDSGDVTQPQMSVVIGMVGEGIPLSTALNAAKVDLGAGQTIAKKFAAIEKALGSSLSASEKKRFLGIESIADPASRLLTSKVGNTLVGTVWNPSTGKFETHILKQFATPGKEIFPQDAEEATEVLIEVLGENQWNRLSPNERNLNIENYLRSLQLGVTPKYAGASTQDESFFGGHFGQSLVTRPTTVLPPNDFDIEIEQQNFRNNNPRPGE
jgi:hypothetical protein